MERTNAFCAKYKSHSPKSPSESSIPIGDSEVHFTNLALSTNALLVTLQNHTRTN